MLFMAELTGYERVMRTFKREPVDTMPFFSGMGMVLLPAIKKLRVQVPSDPHQCRKNRQVRC